MKYTLCYLGSIAWLLSVPLFSNAETSALIDESAKRYESCVYQQIVEKKQEQEISQICKQELNKLLEQFPKEQRHQIEKQILAQLSEEIDVLKRGGI